jgi:nucleoside-diphosphate-sugar epimerase
MSHLISKKVIVTGAAGFVGANLVHRLCNEGVEVFAILRPGTDQWRLKGIGSGLSLLECDLKIGEDIERVISRIKPDVVFNCAFPKGYPSSAIDQFAMLDFSTRSTFLLLESARKNKCGHFVQIGSSLEYGLSKTPHTETDRLEPVTHRGACKAISTLLCQQYAREHHLNLSVLRLFSVYGPWEIPKRLIPTTCNAIIKEQPLMLTSPGLMHDWIYIDDVAEACEAVLLNEVPFGEVVNIGSGKQYTNENVVNTLFEIAGKEVSIRLGGFKSNPYDTEFWVANIQHAKDILNWEPKVTLESGLGMSYRFWEEYFLANGSR